MKTLKQMAKASALAVLAAAAQSGCVAIPCGTETFTTEYSTDIRATDEAVAKEYAPTVAAETVEGQGAALGLAGDITVTQSQERGRESVTLLKKKYMAFGFFPTEGAIWTDDKKNLARQNLPYQGDGVYSTMLLTHPPKEQPHGSIKAWNAGADDDMKILYGLFYTPFSLLFGAFLPYDSDRHVTGQFMGEETKYTDNGVPYKYITRDMHDIELLQKFSPEDRERIGAWTFQEDATHPHNTFRNSYYDFSLFGFHKWTHYAMQDPVSLPGTPAPPLVTTNHFQAKGPYGVFLQIPELGFARTVEIPRGETRACFDLQEVATGQETAQATVRFLPPSGGMEEAWNDDVRALLELVAGMDLPVVVDLPLPRLE